MSAFKISRVSASTITPRFLSSVERETYSKTGHKSTCEIDNHADVTVVGSNFTPLEFTGECYNVNPFVDSYEPIPNVPVATAATAFVNPENGKTIILIFNQVLWMGEKMLHSLICPNQVRMAGVLLCDDPFDPYRQLGMHIGDLTVPFFLNKGSVVFESYAPSQKELLKYTRYEVTVDQPWEPESVDRATGKYSPTYHAMAIGVSNIGFGKATAAHDNNVYLSSISAALNTRMMLQELVSSIDVPSLTETTKLSSVNRNNRHATLSADQLAKNWRINRSTALDTINATTQASRRQAIHPLTRRYRTDLMQMKHRRLSDRWYTDTMFSSYRSIKGNTCAQIFTNTGFRWSNAMANKAGAGDSLNMFCHDVGVPNMLIFDGALEQVGANSTFMHAIRKNNINWQTTEPYSPWQNRAEDAIREIKRRMKRRRVRDDIPKRLWDFQLNYECDIMNLTATGPDRQTNYERVTGDTPDISEYVDFGFYDPVWFWDHPTNTENPHIGRWLGVSHRVGSIMCYYVIKANGHIESRTTLQRVTDEELLKPEFQQKITDFDSKLRD